MIPSDPRAVHAGELPEHPPGSWVDVAPVRNSAPPTEPDAVPTPVLDLVTLGNARAALSDAQLLTVQGYHDEALLFAREALRKLSLALSIRDRRALLERLVEDSEPLLSGERDTRQAEVG